jgi:hypothetical protein
VHQSYDALRGRTVWIDEQGNHAGLRDQLGKQLQPFRVQRIDKQADARQIAARPGETNDKTIRDRICANNKDDWDRRS